MRLKRAYIEITNACNRRCAHCPPHHRPERFMSLPEFEAILDAASPFVRHLYFHCKGEPLLHPLVGDFAALANRRGFYVNLTTNGDLIERHAACRAAHYAALFRNLRQLNVSLHSAENPEALLETLLGIRGVTICLRLWDGGRNARAEAALRTLFHFPQGQTGRLTLRENLFLSIAKPFQWPDLSRPPLYPNGYCKALSQQIGVLADGTVVPCCLDGEGDIPLGNAFADGLAAPLHSPRARAMVEGHRRRSAVEALCQTCSYKNRF